MNRDDTCRALGHIAWAYLFIHLDLNLGALDVLPNWAGYLLVYRAVCLLPQVRDLALLKPFCVLLGLWEGGDWLWKLTGGTLSLYPLNLAAFAVSLYFHFQLLTDLALLAEEEPAAADLGRPLRRLRTARTLFTTAVFLLAQCITADLSGIAALLLLAPAVAAAVVGVALVLYLFTLRRRFTDAGQ